MPVYVPVHQAVGCDHGCTRYQQGDDGFQQLRVAKAGAAAGGQHRVEHQRDLRVLLQDVMYGAGVGGAAEHADLESGYRHVCQHGLCLRDDGIGIERGKAGNITRVLHGQCREDRCGMAILAGECLNVSLQSGAAPGVMAGKGHYDCGLFHAVDNNG